MFSILKLCLTRNLRLGEKVHRNVSLDLSLEVSLRMKASSLIP